MVCVIFFDNEEKVANRSVIVSESYRTMSSALTMLILVRMGDHFNYLSTV